MSRVFTIILALTAVLAIVACARTPAASATPPVAIIGGKPFADTPASPAVGAMLGNLAPDFRLPSLTGQEVSLSRLRGQPVIVNFWATWCPPCVYEMPFLQEVNEKWSAKGLVVLTINVGESPFQVKDFMQRQRLSLPVLLDTSGETAEKYNIRYFPTTFFIDGSGIIRDIRVGAFGDRSAIEDRLRKIMP